MCKEGRGWGLVNMENRNNINNHGVSVQARRCYKNQVVYKKVFQKLHVIIKVSGVSFSISSSHFYAQFCHTLRVITIFIRGTKNIATQDNT